MAGFGLKKDISHISPKTVERGSILGFIEKERLRKKTLAAPSFVVHPVQQTLRWRLPRTVTRHKLLQTNSAHCSLSCHDLVLQTRKWITSGLSEYSGLDPSYAVAWIVAPHFPGSLTEVSQNGGSPFGWFCRQLNWMQAISSVPTPETHPHLHKRIVSEFDPFSAILRIGSRLAIWSGSSVGTSYLRPRNCVPYPATENHPTSVSVSLFAAVLKRHHIWDRRKHAQTLSYLENTYFTITDSSLRPGNECRNLTNRGSFTAATGLAILVQHSFVVLQGSIHKNCIQTVCQNHRGSK